MDIKRSGSQPSAKGLAEYFTGTVRIDPLFEAHEPARTSGASVTFEPGARTAWHTHPLGQTLILTAGGGRRRGRARPLPAGCSDSMAHPPVGTDPNCHGWLRSCTALGRLDRANSSG